MLMCGGGWQFIELFNPELTYEEEWAPRWLREGPEKATGAIN